METDNIYNNNFTPYIDFEREKGGNINNFITQLYMKGAKIV